LKATADCAASVKYFPGREWRTCWKGLPRYNKKGRWAVGVARRMRLASRVVAASKLIKFSSQRHCCSIQLRMRKGGETQLEKRGKTGESG